MPRPVFHYGIKYYSNKVAKVNRAQTYIPFSHTGLGIFSLVIFYINSTGTAKTDESLFFTFKICEQLQIIIPCAISQFFIRFVIKKFFASSDDGEAVFLISISLPDDGHDGNRLHGGDGRDEGCRKRCFPGSDLPPR